MPFIKTAFFGGKQSNVDINHVTAVRIRVTGSGILRSKLLSYGEVQSNILNNITMSANTANPETILADFTSFTSKLEVQTTAIDEIFNVSQIIIWIRPVASQYPM